MRRTRNWIMVYSRKPPIGLLSNREPSLRKGFSKEALAKTGSAEPEFLRIQPDFLTSRSPQRPTSQIT
jgi:hypothetical protein